jgi:hypothetical protein
MRQRTVGRALVVVGLTPVLLIMTITPAAAHSGGSDAPYYRTQIAAVTPQPTGVTARVDPAGEWIEVTYAGTGNVVILGYLREPYLRVTATSVEENTLSQSTYLNQAMFADMSTASPQPMVAPTWRQVAASGTARWHDHRIHWMGQNRPPVVAADPTHPHPVGSWTVHALVGSSPFEIRGTIEWLGRPQGVSAVVWIFLGLFFVLLLILTGLSNNAFRRSAYRAPPNPSSLVDAPRPRERVAR